MKLAYVDTSCLVAVSLGEPGVRKTAALLRRAERLFSANLLEAEFRATMKREGVVDGTDEVLSWISWVFPNRPLTAEIQAVLDHGFVRGADLWHLACALYLANEVSGVSFLTLDERQSEIARKLGLPS